MALSQRRSHRHVPQGEVTIILQKRMQRQQKRAPRVMLKKVGGSLPQHLIVEILSWLPVKCLFKFRAVCKSWYSIMKDPYLISKHMQNYYKNNDEHHGCLIAQYMAYNSLSEHVILLDDKTQRVLASEEIRIPKSNTYYICGPCDGLYFLWCWSDHSRIMWNPALDEFKVMPPLISNSNHPSHIIFEHFESYGFGYDPRTKDYKVIIAKGFRDTSNDHHMVDYPLSVFIYSLKDDSWRYWGDMMKYYYLVQNKCYVFVNNSVYWLGSTNSDDYYRDFDVIIAFNLATDSYQELKMPSYEKPALERSPALAVCHDSISLLLNYQENNRFVMWCFDEIEQWTKKCIINLEELESYSYFEPLGHWKGNKILFANNQKIIMYDVVTQQKWYLNNPRIHHGRCTNISAYEESLIPLIDRNDEPPLKGLYVPKNWFMLHTDASFISKAEPSGLAGCIRKNDGDWQLGFMEKIYATDALMAEILSILKGIVMSHNNGFNRIMVYSDCQRAVDLVNQADHPAYDMYYNVVTKCREWMLKMQKVKVRFSGKGNNTIANAMAQYCRENISEINVTRTIPFPPKYCKSDYLSDCFYIARF